MQGRPLRVSLYQGRTSIAREKLGDHPVKGVGQSLKWFE